MDIILIFVLLTSLLLTLHVSSYLTKKEYYTNMSIEPNEYPHAQMKPLLHDVYNVENNVMNRESEITDYNVMDKNKHINPSLRSTPDIGTCSPMSSCGLYKRKKD